MSFFGSLMGDLDDYPIFRSHMQSVRDMNDMMNFLFNDPFSIMGHPCHNAITHGSHRNRGRQGDLQILPFGFPPLPSFNMGNVFPDFDNMVSNENCHSYTSVMTFGTNESPQVYQQTMSTTTVPGGVKETRRTICDSRTGTKKMAIEHHIGDRAHILEREQNVHSGEQEEHQEFINLDEEEAESFNNEWESRVRHYQNSNSNYGSHGHRNRSDHRQQALPDTSGSSNSSNTIQATKSVSAASTSIIGNQKRKHILDAKVCKKCRVVSHSND
ncbi:Myeloid leukemia factor [Eufriesea mexicana]|uniref:myeloid leukemia factor isoform X2 n=1 Tax=Eufriesea mexicana TaxID=516756 RepID=UPI00083BDFC8|nr:PREDICTED: myeloid leukemia factor isoform X2 [Eufriesea mexicana]OAD54810.1 Myeloid leukemia factor [Eufriesea mexicana]